MIEDTALWYSAKSRVIAHKFLLETDEVIDFLSIFPLSKQIRFDNVRMAFFKTFPFSVHYILEDNKIIILRILHTSKDPLNWKTL